MDDRDLAKLLAAQARQIERLAGLIERQTEMFAAPRVTTIALSESNPTTVNDLWKKYDAVHSAIRWWKTAQGQIKAPLAYFGPMLVRDIRRSHWVEYRDHVRGKQILPSGRPPADGTLNLELKRLKALGNWAVAEELILKSPWAGIKLKKVGGRETTVSAEGLAAVLKVSPDWLRAMILVSVDSGLRVGEVRLLKWTEVNLDTGIVSLPWGRTKTRTSRKGFLSDRAIDAVKLYPRLLGCPYVLPNLASGRPYAYSRVSECWRRAVAEADLTAAPGDRTVKFHDLRHSACTQMVQAGAHPQVAQRAVGHTTAAQNWKYTHLEESDLLELKARMDAAILAGPRKPPSKAPTESPDNATHKNRHGQG